MRDDNGSRWLFPDPPLSATLNFAILCLEAKKVPGAFVRSFHAMDRKNPQRFRRLSLTLSLKSNSRTAV
jgi:hypothetical protein